MQLLLILWLASPTIRIEPIGATKIHACPSLDIGLVMHSPHPPVAIDLGVMQPKYGLTRTDKDVAAQVAPDAVVAGDVQGGKAVGRVCLQAVLEGGYVLICSNVGGHMGGQQKVVGEEV